jgi:proline iminopeptidase
MRVQVGDVRLFFDVDGAKLRPGPGGRLEERPTVVILHAGPGLDHAPYKETLGPSLVDLAQVVYLDQRGHGRSDRSDPERWNLDTWAGDVRAFCERLSIERPVLLGQGWGAMIAVRLAARWPNLPAKLVLAGPLARIVPDRSIAVFERLGGAAAGEAAFRFYRQPTELSVAEYLRVCFPLLGRKERPPGTLLRAQWNFEALIHWQLNEGHVVDLRREAARVTAPTLVLQGENDPQMPLVGAAELVDELPVARLVTYPEGRHALYHDEPEAVDAVREFVRS